MIATFRYFALPHRFSTYHEESHQCDLCNQHRPGYGAQSFSDIEFVCEECLAAARLADLDFATNQGDVAALRTQVRERMPQLSDTERGQMVQERTAELKYRTPHLVTWQDVLWPAHCGDYFRFIKEVGQPELADLSSDGNGPAFLAAHAHNIAGAKHAMEVWEGVRPDIPQDNRVAYSLGMYLFRCLTCNEYVLLWDCD